MRRGLAGESKVCAASGGIPDVSAAKHAVGTPNTRNVAGLLSELLDVTEPKTVLAEASLY